MTLEAECFFRVNIQEDVENNHGVLGKMMLDLEMMGFSHLCQSAGWDPADFWGSSI